MKNQPILRRTKMKKIKNMLDFLRTFFSQSGLYYIGNGEIVEEEELFKDKNNNGANKENE